MTFANGAWTLMARRVPLSRAGSWRVTKASAVATAFKHELVEESTQVSITLEKPASLPPIVMLTSVLLALSADTWVAWTSAVVAPEQATEAKLVGEFAPAHCSGYAFALRSQFPLDEM
jgi:hypothetical protein